MGVAHQGHVPHRRTRRRAGGPAAPGGRPADRRLPIGQPRRGRLRRPVPARRHPGAQPAPGLRLRHPLLPRGVAGPTGAAVSCSTRVLTRLPDLQLARRCAALPYRASNFIVGPEAMPVTFTPTARPRMSGPLEGVRLVELGAWIAGPAAGGILADWGADVVKIEPPAGDPARTFQRMLGGDLPVNPVFELDNRGKRSIALDLSTEEGLDVARPPRGRSRRPPHQPAARGAVPGRARPRPVRARHPGLVYALITGYGTEGPDAERGATTSAPSGPAPASRSPCARRGTIAVPTWRHGRPQRGHDGSGHGERGSRRASPHRTGAGGHDLAAAPGRVHHRLRRERCAHVGPQPRHRHAETMYSPTLNNIRRGTGAPLDRGPRGRSSLAGPGPAVGHPEWIDDERFADARRPRPACGRADRPARRDLLHPALERVAGHLRRGSRDVLESGQHGRRRRGRRAVPRRRLRGPGPGRAGQPAHARHPGRLRRPPAPPRFRAPLLGEHTRELLAELGLDEPSVDTLLAAGAAVDGRPDGRSAGQQDDQKL